MKTAKRKPSTHIKRAWRASGRVQSLKAWARIQINDGTAIAEVAASWLRNKGVAL